MRRSMQTNSTVIAFIFLLLASSCKDPGVDSPKPVPIPTPSGIWVEILDAQIDADLMPHFPPSPPSLDCGFIVTVKNLSTTDTLSGLSIPDVDVFSPDSLGRIDLMFIPLTRVWDGQLLPNEMDTVSVGGWSNRVSRIPCGELAHFHSRICKGDSVISEFRSQEIHCWCVSGMR